MIDFSRVPFFFLPLFFVLRVVAQSPGSGSIPPVEFSQTGGLFAAPVGVTLSCTTPGAAIHYTLDGTEPTAQSATYTGLPLIFNNTTALRVRAFAPGSHSPVTTHTYFVGVSHSFPVVSLVFEPAAFFDSLSGIYVNYQQDLNAIANIEFFENGAEVAAFNQLVEVEIQGTGSAALEQKSLEIKAKGSLGESKVQYPIFPDLPFEEYKRFVLRNGGQDWCVMQFRDAFAASLMFDRSDLGDILKKPNLHLQAYRPAVVYLNGEYWGIHNVRERMNRFYVQQHFDWEEDEFDMVENFGEMSSGDSVAWFQFFNYLEQTPTGFDDDAVFESLKQQIDYQNFLDYCAFNIYLENEDWPGNNVLRFRHRSAADKWRWMTYDLDFTFGLFQFPTGWNTGDPSPNALARLLDDSSFVWPNPDWATLLFRRCWQNAGFRRDFANRLADMLNTAFVPERVCARLDEFRALYQPEMPQHYQRWWSGNFTFVWLDNIERTRFFAQHRPEYVRQEILTAMAEAYDLANLEVDVFPPNGGRIEVNTVQPSGVQFPWKGTYFVGVPLPVKAVANPGYKFVGWSKLELGTADSVGLLLTDSTFLVAYFELEDSTIINAMEVNELSFNVSPNPTTGSVTIFGENLKHGTAHVQLLNQVGQVVLQTSFAPNPAGRVLLEMPGLANGVYFLKIKSEEGHLKSLRVIKR
jgi:hypothetical protein